MANMAKPAENPTYGRMAHEMRENMKHSKTTVVFSPSAALTGPITSSFAANTPTCASSNKRNAQSDFEDRSGKKVSLESNAGNAQIPQAGSQNSGPQNITAGIASAELNQAVDARVVSLIRKSVNATIKKTLDEVKEHKTIYGMPIWPDAFPLKLDGQEKVRRTHEAAVKDILESLLCPDDNGQPPMADLGRILGSLIPTGAPIINDNLAQSNSAPKPMAITTPRRVASLGNGSGQTTGVGSSKGKGVCVPNVVQVDGGVGLLINGGKGFVPLPGLPKSHQKKPSKGKAVAPAAVHQNDSAALQDALRTGDVVKAQEITSRIFPETSALGSSPEAPPKRKRTPARPKATGNKKKEDVNQSLASAADNATDGAFQNRNQAQATRSRFFPFPSGDPVMAGPSKEVDNKITDETLNSVDLDELTRQTFGTSEATGSSGMGPQGIFDGMGFNLTLESILSRPVNNTAESERKGKSVVSVGEGGQMTEKSHEEAPILQSPGPVDPFDASFNFDQHLSFLDLPATSPTTEASASRSGRFHPFPTGDNSSAAAIGNPVIDFGATAVTDSTNNGAEWTIPSQGQASTSAAGAAPSLALDNGKDETQASPKIAPEGSGSQTIDPSNDAEENAELATAVANALKDLHEAGLNKFSAEDLMAARHDKKTLEAVAQLVKDEVFEFEWWQVLKDFCDGNEFPYPFDVSFKVNATAPTVSDDPARVWKTQDERFCSDFTSEEIMWGAAVYGWNSTPARYRFAKDHETDTIGAITPYYFIANGVTVTVCRDPEIFPILGNPKPTMCEWDSIKLAAQRDGEFADLVGNIYPHYWEKISWNVNFHTADLFYTPEHVRQQSKKSVEV